MYKCSILFLLIFLFFAQDRAFAQNESNAQDSFFLRKKGLIGKLARAVSTTPPPDAPPEKLENPFLRYKLKKIRFINLIPLGFDRNINDANIIKNSFWIRIASQLHKNTTAKVIKRNLFFKEGDLLYPYLVADNERYLRDIVFFQDARIVVENADDSSGLVDVFVITKDVFSIGGHARISSTKQGRIDAQEENFRGTGSQVSGGLYYDQDRKEKMGYNAEIVKRNIRGSFLDLTGGFKNYGPSIRSNRNEETSVYATLERPLVTPYMPWTGAIQGGYFVTRNEYINDTFYKHQDKYEYYDIDGWVGHSLDSRKALYAEREIKIHQFVGLRIFDEHFFSAPDTFKTIYDYHFASSKGILASYYIFRQTFYKTNYIYGFGRNEDVPEGFSIAATVGWLNVRDSGWGNDHISSRPYAGIDMQLTNFKKKGCFNDLTFRAGAFIKNSRLEDVDLLFNLNRFSSLKKLSRTWYNRMFFSAGIAGQINPALNQSLNLSSMYGLPYFYNDDSTKSDMRATVRVESVFFNTRKLLGLRFAPFIFADASLLKKSTLNLKNSDMYSGLGGGIRSRNENLVFGTVELRAYYFPRVIRDMNSFKIEFTSNLKFKYNSTFIRRPDFVQPN